MSTCTVWLMTAILSAATQPQAVGVFADGRIEPWDPTQEIVEETLPDHLWIWSAVAPPVRLSAREMLGGPPLLLPAARWVRVSTLTDGAGDERYRLHAAPAEMWAEVPEPLLPRWEMDPALPFVLPVEREGAWRLRAIGDGTASGWIDVATNATAVDLAVMPASPASSRLVTDQGLPVAAADARLRRTGGPLDTVETVAIWRADHKGVLTLPPAPRNGSLDLRFEAGGVVARQIHTTPVAFPETIVLTTGRVLNGVVVQTDGTGIPGAHVGYETWLPGQGGLLRRSATSDAAGRWRISGVAEGRFSLRFEAPGFAPSTQIHSAADEVALLRAVLSLAATRTIEVVDDTGSPVAQAGITGSGGVTASSDESGLAVLGGIAEDRQLVLRVDASGHLPSRTTRRPPLPDPVTVILERSFHVRGRFVSPRGEPVEAGRLVVETSSGLRTLELAGDAGFAIDLPPGEKATLHLFARDAASLDHELQAGEPGEVRELGDLPAPPSLRAYGRVVDSASGRPLAGAVVAADFRADADELFTVLGTGERSTRSDTNGEFSLAGLDEGATLWVEMAGRAAESVRVQPGSSGAEEVDVGDVPLSSGATVRVHSPDDARRAFARLKIGPGRELSSPVAGGLAVFDQVPLGTFTLSVSTEVAEVCRRTIEVLAGGQIDVECRADTVHVRGVALADGRPVGDGHLVWLSDRRTARPAAVFHERSPTGLTQTRGEASGPPQVDVPVEADGSFETSNLRPGRWQVAWLAGGGDDSAGPVWVEVPAGEEWRPVLDLSSPDGDQLPASGHHSGG